MALDGSRPEKSQTRLRNTNGKQKIIDIDLCRLFYAVSLQEVFDKTNRKNIEKLVELEINANKTDITENEHIELHAFGD